MKKLAAVLSSVLLLSMMLMIVAPVMAKTGQVIVVVKDKTGNPVGQTYWVTITYTGSTIEIGAPTGAGGVAFLPTFSDYFPTGSGWYANAYDAQGGTFLGQTAFSMNKGFNVGVVINLT